MQEASSVPARQQVEGGAQIIDVCMDDGLIDGVGAMRDFLNLLMAEPDIARVPVMIDSSKWEVIEAGLRCVQGKSVVDSISLKEGEAEFLRRAALVRRYGAAAVVMLFDERGQADTFERKIEVAGRAARLLTEAGFPPEDIVFDPNVLSVATGIEQHDRYGLDFIRACGWIKKNCPDAKVSGGVSNLSFSTSGQQYRARGDAFGFPVSCDRRGRWTWASSTRRCCRFTTRYRNRCWSFARTSCWPAGRMRPSV